MTRGPDGDVALAEDESVDADGLLIEEIAATSPPTRRARSVLVWCALSWITLVFLASMLADALPIPGYGTPVGPPRLPPFRQWGDGLALGTDTFGRSNLSRVIYGARTSMIVAMVATAIGLVIGGLVGLVSGYRRGWVDRSSSFVVDTLLAFPPLLMLMALMSVFQPRVSTVLLGLAILVIPTFIRLQRASAMTWAQRPFVLAARSYGTRDLQIALHHVLPNSVLSLITYVPTIVSGLIVAEGSLSFLGLGVPSPTPSWGGMIAEGKSALRTEPSVVFVPAVVVFLTVLAFNALGEHVRGRFDSRSRG